MHLLLRDSSLHLERVAANHYFALCLSIWNEIRAGLTREDDLRKTLKPHKFDPVDWTAALTHRLMPVRVTACRLLNQNYLAYR